MGFASINPTNPRTNLWNFHEKISRIGDFEKRPFWKISHFEFFSRKKNFFFLLHFYKNQSKFVWQNGWVEILMFSLVSRKFLGVRNITLYSVHHLHWKANLVKDIFLNKFSTSESTWIYNRSHGLQPGLYLYLTDDNHQHHWLLNWTYILTY